MSKNKLYLAELSENKAWQSLRLDFLNLRNYRCELCGSAAQDVHHTTYAHGIICPIEYLQALCRKCHKKQHRK